MRYDRAASPPIAAMPWRTGCGITADAGVVADRLDRIHGVKWPEGRPR